jgi:hypothetical protein
MLQLQLMKIAKNRKRRPARRPARRRAARSVQAAKASAGTERLKRRKKIADDVKLYIEDKKISRAKLEGMVKRSQSTMNHFFAGDFADSLLTRIERALGRPFGQSSSTAPVEWGGYTQEGTAKLVGSYLTLRNDFKDPLQICAYVTAIEWGNIEQAHLFDGKLVQKSRIDGYGLIFREERRVDTQYSHRGQVWFPGGQFLYLVSAYGDGRLRAAIASVPDNGKMTGIQLSLYNPKGVAFTPAAAPIAFLRRDNITNEELGNFRPGHPFYEEYKRIVSGATNDVVVALPSSSLLVAS